MSIVAAGFPSPEDAAPVVDSSLVGGCDLHPLRVVGERPLAADKSVPCRVSLGSVRFLESLIFFFVLAGGATDHCHCFLEWTCSLPLLSGVNFPGERHLKVCRNHELGVGATNLRVDFSGGLFYSPRDFIAGGRLTQAGFLGCRFSCSPRDCL